MVAESNSLLLLLLVVVVIVVVVVVVVVVQARSQSFARVLKYLRSSAEKFLA